MLKKVYVTGEVINQDCKFICTNCGRIVELSKNSIINICVTCGNNEYTRLN